MISAKRGSAKHVQRHRNRASHVWCSAGHVWRNLLQSWPVWREITRQSGSAPAKLTQRRLALNDLARRKVALGGASHVSRARNDPERAQNDEASPLTLAALAL